MGIKNIFLNDIPKQGMNIIIDDAAVWDASIAEFGIICRVITPLCADLHLLPVQGGLLIRGKLTGAVVQPCDLCAEDAPTSLNHTIDTFEATPGESIPLLHDDEDGMDDADDMDTFDEADSHIFLDGHTPVLNLAALCWEEFMLALPLRPVCKDNCKGLCVQCGTNLNENSCACACEQGDPRLAVLRSFKVKNSK